MGGGRRTQARRSAISGAMGGPGRRWRADRGKVGAVSVICGSMMRAVLFAINNRKSLPEYAGSTETSIGGASTRRSVSFITSMNLRRGAVQVRSAMSRSIRTPRPGRNWALAAAVDQGREDVADRGDHGQIVDVAPIRPLG
jgi:hypothetical protein